MEACNVMGASQADLGLTFRPGVSAVALVGRQINGRATTELAAALQQRERLLSAKSAGWPALREEWVNMLAETRSIEDANTHVDAVMRAFRPKRAEINARQMQREIRQQRTQPIKAETPEEQQDRQLAAASRAVEKALDSEVVEKVLSEDQCNGSTVRKRKRSMSR
mmetsp:Transcript_158510/g.281052  ORF Transcript_158510/g.281052 Transcript_158510/m.281052 type:complete len:166 (+) Transcript_158510:1-498(+)